MHLCYSSGLDEIKYQLDLYNQLVSNHQISSLVHLVEIISSFTSLKNESLDVLFLTLASVVTLENISAKLQNKNDSAFLY